MGAEALMRPMYLEGQRRWPLVKLAFEAFQNHCLEVLGSEREDAPIQHGADLFLCCACALGEPEALREFEKQGMRVARSAIARIDRDPDFVQETLQEVWDKLLVGSHPAVARYSGRGPLQAWVRVSAMRAALDRCRARGVAATRETQLTDRFIAPGASPEQSLTRARYGVAFQNALRNAVTALSAQERNVLRMHVCGQCSIDEIGRAYNVHRATAARWLERARTAIYDRVRRDLSSGKTKLTDSEFRSLARAIGSELEIRLSGASARPFVSLAQSAR